MAEWELFGKTSSGDKTITPSIFPATNQYKTLTFTNNGTITFQEDAVCDILIVAGGGGGSGGLGGGGGGGGVAYISNTTLSSSVSYTINVGQGGRGGLSNEITAKVPTGGKIGSNGGDSSISDSTDTIITFGGGTPFSALNNGGSGSGADTSPTEGGIETPGNAIDMSGYPNVFKTGSVSYFGYNGG